MFPRIRGFWLISSDSGNRQAGWKDEREVGSSFYAFKRAQRGFLYIIAVWCVSALLFLTMAANGHLLAQMASFINAIFKRTAFFVDCILMKYS